jgi:hypothetical protein
MTKQNRETIDSLLTELHDAGLELEESKDNLENLTQELLRERKINDFLLKVSNHFFDVGMHIVRSKIEEDQNNG